MNGIISVIGALLVLTVLVFFHELGHFAVGRRLGFGIEEFAIGMGPVVFSKEKDGIRYAVRALPIGGMCMFHGEDAPAEDARSFNAQPVWKRMLVVGAGPVMNILLAVVIAAIILMSYGDYMPGIVGFTEENSPAYEGGLREDDIILDIGGYDISFYEDCTPAIEQANSEETEVTVLRNGEEVVLTVRDFFDEEEGVNRFGIYISPVRMQYGFFEAVGNSVKYVYYLMKEMIGFLGSIFTQGVQSGDVAGPVGTISIIGQAVRAGFEVVLRLGVLISVNLGIMNLLPIPALDGGRLLLMAVEALRGKPIPPETEAKIHFTGFVLLMGLMLLLTVMDVQNLFK